MRILTFYVKTKIDTIKPFFKFTSNQDLHNYIYNPNNPELSKLKNELQFSLYLPDRTKLNYDNIYKNLMELIEYYDKTKNDDAKILIESTYIFLEKNCTKFSIEHAIKLFCRLAEMNMGEISMFNSFQYHLNKKLRTEKGLILQNYREDTNLTKFILYYFAIMAEVSMMEVGNLNYVLQYFAEFSNYLTPKSKNICDFIWYTAISISSILLKRQHYHQYEKYVDTKSNVLDEKGGRSLKKILNLCDSFIESNPNHSENTLQKVRLFRALYYLRLEGVKLSDKSIKFLESFKNFNQIAIENSISNSALEDSFEKILRQIDILYEKEKKLPFCSVDFFIKPHICIEVDGPYHYFLNLPRGKDFLKERVLTLEKYEYIAIDYRQLSDKPDEVLDRIKDRVSHLKKQINLEKEEEERKEQMEERKVKYEKKNHKKRFIKRLFIVIIILFNYIYELK